MGFLPTDFAIYIKGAAILTAVALVLAIAGFLFQWGFRFRLVGVTAFMGVITLSILGLSLGLFQRTEIPGAGRYALVFDNASSNVVIVVPDDVTPEVTQATLRQAAIDVSPYGRLGGNDGKIHVRARTVLHPEPGLTKPLFLGEARKLPGDVRAERLEIDLYDESFQQLPQG
ncbi:MAG: DUF2518 family protein [Spirulinaceae cyanobacterium RM2_2_10]|nr:DUF2518 family protein [Spirulinaceae cyanobacterium SM2_1_0]NJO19443.1 DUF2518 family protein [Spirulinaceae cyanobacterium RM2_2_10]